MGISGFCWKRWSEATEPLNTWIFSLGLGEFKLDRRRHFPRDYWWYWQKFDSDLFLSLVV